MKKLRVFQTVKIKGIVPGFFVKHLGTVLLFLFLIPYIVTFLFGNLKEGSAEKMPLEDLNTEYGEGAVYVSNETIMGIENIPLEYYVADKLARSIDNYFEMETLKAQAVLIRSGLLAAGMTGENGNNIRNIKVEDGNYGSTVIPENIYEAVEETAGVYLAYQKQPVNGAYFAVSNGFTRDGEELFPTEYSYLKSVPCSRDFLSSDYASSVIYEENEFEKIWEMLTPVQMTEEVADNGKITMGNEMNQINLYRDSAGYVLYLEREGKCVSGEQFRNAFGLSSASFHLSKEGKKIMITVKGVGHGLGMSQYGANEMAKEGEDYITILNYFFQDVTINKL